MGAEEREHEKEREEFVLALATAIHDGLLPCRTNELRDKALALLKKAAPELVA